MSHNGTLVYTPRNTPSEFPKETVVAVARDGQPRPIADYIGYGGSPRVSPDGTTIVVGTRTGPAMPDLWLHDVKIAKTARLTTSGGGAPVWSPDGRWIAFSRLAHGTWDVYRIRADGSSGAEALVVGKDHQYPASWSSDGSSLFLVEQNQTGVRDLLVLSPVAPGTPTALVATAARERAPMISPNGQLLAYVSNETGRDEVYVQRYPEMIRRVQVFTDGGAEPMWSPDGEELFYRNERSDASDVAHGRRNSQNEAQGAIRGVLCRDRPQRSPRLRCFAGRKGLCDAGYRPHIRAFAKRTPCDPRLACSDPSVEGGRLRAGRTRSEFHLLVRLVIAVGISGSH